MYPLYIHSYFYIIFCVFGIYIVYLCQYMYICIIVCHAYAGMPSYTYLHKYFRKFYATVNTVTYLHIYLCRKHLFKYLLSFIYIWMCKYVCMCAYYITVSICLFYCVISQIFVQATCHSTNGLLRLYKVKHKLIEVFLKFLSSIF